MGGQAKPTDASTAAHARPENKGTTSRPTWKEQGHRAVDRPLAPEAGRPATATRAVCRATSPTARSCPGSAGSSPQCRCQRQHKDPQQPEHHQRKRQPEQRPASEFNPGFHFIHLAASSKTMALYSRSCRPTIWQSIPCASISSRSCFLQLAHGATQYLAPVARICSALALPPTSIR